MRMKWPALLLAGLCFGSFAAEAQKVSTMQAASAPLSGAELLYCIQGGQSRKCTASLLSSLAGLPHASNNGALSQTGTAVSTLVLRTGFATQGDAPPLIYIASTGPCSLNGGAGDGGSQVPSADGKCWLAAFETPIDVRQFGADPTGTNDSVPGIQAAVNLGSDHNFVFPPGSYVFKSLNGVPNYPATGNYGVTVRGVSNAVFDMRGATFQMDNAHTAGETFGWENNTDIRIIGGTLIGNRTGLPGTQENAGDAFFSNNRLRVEARSCLGDWSVLGACAAGNFNTASYFEWQEIANAGICTDFGQMDNSEFIFRKVSGGSGQQCFSDVWDPNFATTTRLTAGASQGTTSLSVPNLTITGVANNGSGGIRYTVASTANLVSGGHVVAGVVGVPAANGNILISIIDGTHFDALGPSFSGSYTGGGTIIPLFANGDRVAVGSAGGGYVYVNATGAASGGSLPITAMPSAEGAGATVVDLKYNQTGVDFVEGFGNKVTMLRGLGGFNTQGLIDTGSGWLLDGNYENNAGGIVAGLGVTVAYTVNGSFSSAFHPVGSVILRGRYSNNGNAAHGGWGILVQSGQITNGVDQIGPITLDNVALDGNITIGADASSLSGLATGSSIGSGTRCFNPATQTVCIGTNLQQAADPPPTVGTPDAGFGSGATAALNTTITPTGSSGFASVSTGTTPTAIGNLPLTWPTTVYSDWQCQFSIIQGGCIQSLNPASSVYAVPSSGNVFRAAVANGGLNFCASTASAYNIGWKCTGKRP